MSNSSEPNDSRIIDPLAVEWQDPEPEVPPAEYLPGDADAPPRQESIRQRPFTVWKPDDFLAYQVPPGMDLMENGLLRRGELSLLVGQGGLGKSRMSLWLACCQITGRPWCGLTTEGEPATFLLVGNENGLIRWKKDLETMRANFNAEEWALLNRHLRLVALVEPEDGIMILTDCWKRMERTLIEVQPDVLVLDPWAAFIPGNENDSRDTRDAVNWLFRLLRHHAPRAALLVVAHARSGRDNARKAMDNFESGGFIRGNKSMWQVARAQFNLVPGSAEDRTQLVLACGKGNNGTYFEARGLRFNVANFAYEVDPGFDLREWLEIVENSDTANKADAAAVWEAVYDNHRQARDIAAYLLAEWNTPRRTAERLIQTALAKGYIESVPPRGSYALGPNRPPGVQPPSERPGASVT